jgi:transposase InsO family protein
MNRADPDANPQNRIALPNQVWAMDITSVPMARGFVYLAAVVDWFSRRVLSWRVSISLEAAFCVEALEEALARHGRPEVFNTVPPAVCETPDCMLRGPCRG